MNFTDDVETSPQTQKAAPRTVTGTVTMNPRGFAFIELDEQTGNATSCFLPPALAATVLDGDTVRARVTPEDDGSLTARTVFLLTRDHTELVGTIDGRDGNLFLRPDPHVGHCTFPLRDQAGVSAGQMARATLVGRSVSVTHTWPSPSDPEALTAAICARYGITPAFPDQVLAEAQAATTASGEHRADLRSQTVFTVDADDTKDLDDALTVFPAEPDGSIRVQVHIADVAAAVAEGTALDREARRTSTSVYLPGLVRPMLPTVLSEDKLSLLPGEDRDTVTVEFTVHPDGTCGSVSAALTTVRSTCRVNYMDATAVLTGREPHEHFPSAVTLALADAGRAADLLTKDRQRRGSASWRDESSARITVTGGRIGVHHDAGRPEHAARQMIERLMVAANEAVASWLAQRGRATLTRVHQGPDRWLTAALELVAAEQGIPVDIPTEFTPATLAATLDAFASAGNVARRAAQSLTLKALPRAEYTTDPGEHFGLGSERYLHFTSPIRRYADILVHRAIRAELLGDRRRNRGLDKLAGHINKAASTAGKAESQLRRALWLSTIADDRAAIRGGWLSNITDRSISVTLETMPTFGVVDRRDLPRGWWIDEELLRVVTPTGPLHLGESVAVQVTGADPAAGTLTFRFVQQSASVVRAPKRRPERPRVRARRRHAAAAA